MSEIAQINHFQIGKKEIDTLVKASIIPSGTPPDQVGVFARVCQEKGLSPFSKEIYLVKYNSKKNGPTWQVITGIDGFRKRAAITGEFAGKDEPKFNCKSDGTYQTLFEVKKSGSLPISCRVTIYRIKGGVRVPFVGEVLFDEYAGRYNNELTGKWREMPYHMIAKCAEGFALRSGFSDELSGLHLPEEKAAFEDTNTGPILTEDQVNEREMELDAIKQSLVGLTKEQLRAKYDANPSYRMDEEITNLFIGAADSVATKQAA